jgi:hypothetical protein
MRRIFGPRRDEVEGELNDVYPHSKLFGRLNREYWDGMGM